MTNNKISSNISMKIRINLKLELTYLTKWYDVETKRTYQMGEVVIKNETVGPFNITDKPKEKKERLRPIYYKKDLGKPSIQAKLRVEYKDLNKFKQNTPFNDLLKSLYIDTLENKTNKQKSDIFYGSVAYDYNRKATEHNRLLIIKRKKNKADKVKNKKQKIPPHTTEEINSIVEGYNTDDGYKITKVLSFTVDFMDMETINRNRKPRNQQPMNRSFILKSDWLKYGEGIAKVAYEETDGICVYNQLEHILLNEEGSRRPTKFIKNRRTSEEALFTFFQETIHNRDWSYKYLDFNKFCWSS